MHFTNTPKAGFARNHDKGGVSDGGQGRDREKGKEKDQVLAKARDIERRRPLSAAIQKLSGWEFSCPANELCAQGLNALSLKTCVLPGGEPLQEQSQIRDTLPYAPIYMVLSEYTV